MRLTWDKARVDIDERATLDQQMFNNMCHLNDPDCFLTVSPKQNKSHQFPPTDQNNTSLPKISIKVKLSEWSIGS